MKSNALLIALLGVHGVLIALWFLQKPRSSPAPSVEATAGSHPSTETATQTLELPGKGIATASNRVEFTWRAVLDRDLNQYIAKLRQVQCPEETIQDIILAEVDRLYAAKEAAIGFRREFIRVWEMTEPVRERDFEKAARLRQLRVEKRNLIYELLGIDVPGEMPSLVGNNFNTAWEQALALLPLEKRGPVRAAQDRFWEQTETLRKRLDNMLLPEDAEEYRRLRAERVDALKKVLTPAEFDDLEMRTSTTGNSLRTELTYFSPSESEFRELFKIKRDLHETTYVPGQIIGDDENKRSAHLSEANQRAEAQIQSILGETRYAEYQRARDNDFQQISRVAADSGLSSDVAVTAYNAQKQTQALIQQALQDPTLTQAQRLERRAQIQTESINQIRSLVGETAFKQLQQRVPGRFREPRVVQPRTAPGVPGTPGIPLNFVPAP